jgi:hypothetical protein
MLVSELLAEVERRADARNHEVIRAVLRTESAVLPFICAHCYHRSRLIKARKELVRLEGTYNSYESLWRRQPGCGLGIKPVWMVDLGTQIADLKKQIEDDTLSVSLTEGCGDCRACRVLPPPPQKTRRTPCRPGSYAENCVLASAPEPTLTDPDNPAPYTGRTLSPDTFEFFAEGGEGD